MLLKDNPYDFRSDVILMRRTIETVIIDAGVAGNVGLIAPCVVWCDNWHGRRNKDLVRPWRHRMGDTFKGGRASPRYEQEIRFVFGANPAITELQGGVLIELNSKVLLQDILVSDLIPEDEADLISDLLIKFKSGKLRSPNYPRKENWKS
jgi:hypothetical protein